MSSTERLAELRRNLVEHFSLDGLKTLCADLNVDFDNLPGETAKESKARELLDLLDRQGRIPNLIRRCTELRPQVQWREIVADADTQSPFKGLQYFDVGDAELFFGREDLTAQLVHRIDPAALKEVPRFLAVVGASGSGKSSLVRAGLVAALESGQPLADGTQPPVGSRDWRVHVITPTADPLQALAASLTRDSESVTVTATLMDDLARDPRSLHLYALKLTSLPPSQARGGGNQGGGPGCLLLVVDQFEELFTQCKDEAKRKAFVDNLITAASPDMHGPTLVVIALRADFYAQCGQYEALRALLEKQQAFVGPMNKDELRRAIEEPTQRHGYTVEPGLTDALLETWKRRRGRMLTLQGYAESGELRGAIAKTADDTFAKLPPDQQAIARNIFLRLTELGEGAPDTRRRARLDELISQPGNAAGVNSVLQTLADARLITTGEGTAEVAHEALIREWPVLIRWLNDDREGLRVQRQLTEDAGRWQEMGRDEGALYRGLALGRATQWAEAHGGELSALEREFVAASRAQAEAERDEREAQRRRELEQAQQLAEEQRKRAEEQRHANTRLRQRAWLLTGIAAIALVLAGVAFLFFQQANAATILAKQNAVEAQKQAQVAQKNAAQAETQAQLALSYATKAGRLAIQATLIRESESDLSLLLAHEAYTREPVFGSQSALLAALQAYPSVLTYMRAHTNTVTSVAFSPDSKTLASGSEDNTILLWDVSNPAQPSRIGQPLAGHTGTVLSVAFSPDGKTLASGSGDKTIRLWDVDIESWMRRACQIANRNLTQAEWQQYLGDEPYHKTCPDLPAGE